MSLTMKNILQGSVFSQNTRGGRSRLWLAVLFGLLVSVPATQATDRVVAWGDLNYEFTIGTLDRQGVAQISAGSFHSLVLQKDRNILAWGDNRFGQISIPTKLQRKPVKEIAA